MVGVLGEQLAVVSGGSRNVTAFVFDLGRQDARRGMLRRLPEDAFDQGSRRSAFPLLPVPLGQAEGDLLGARIEIERAPKKHDPPVGVPRLHQFAALAGERSRVRGDFGGPLCLR